MAGFEVDDVDDLSARAQGVVVGHVLERDKHPNADKLSVCSVDVGAQSPFRSFVVPATFVPASMFRWRWSEPPSPPLA
jgi:tRNA-binding EMAP/Myf-like protein